MHHLKADIDSFTFPETKEERVTSIFPRNTFNNFHILTQ